MSGDGQHRRVGQGARQSHPAGGGALEHPWGEYRRARLPAGLTYVVGREVIEAGLVRAGARVRSLSLGRPDLPLRAGASTVFDMYFYGDARPHSFPAGTPRADLLLMRWTALPVAVATEVRQQVAQVWLDQGCAWAGCALVAGNTWAAAEHRWSLVVDDGVLSVAQT